MSNTKIVSQFIILLAISGCQPRQTPQSFNPGATFQGQNTRFQSSSRSNGMNVYVGNLHSHTSFSDGILTPREAYTMAKGNGLDFMAVTEHNHSAAGGSDGIYLTPDRYEELKKTAQEFTRNGEFVAMYGQEFSTISSGNHMNIFEANEIVRVQNGDFKTLYEKWLPAHPEVPFVQFNHPNVDQDLGLASAQAVHPEEQEEAAMHPTEVAAPEGSKQFNDYGYDDYGRDFQKLARAANPYVQTIEILNGPGTNPKPLPKVDAYSEKDYLFYLNQGFQLAPVADQDNHYAHWGSLSPARTGVVAAELTKPALYDALRKRHVFATEDNNLFLTLKSGNFWMGDIVPPQANMTLEITATDADEKTPLQVLIYADQVGGSVARPVHQAQIMPGETLTWNWENPQAGMYVFAKVSQLNATGTQDDAWTAPLFVQ
jgi:hypothetical protein